MSLVETVIAFTLLAALGVIFGETMTVSLSADRYVSAFNAAATKGQRSANEIQDDLTAARRVYSDDAEGRNYAGATELWDNGDQLGLPLPIGTSRLPTTDSNGTFAPDTENHQTTGNALLFVREQGTALVNTTKGPVARTLRFDLFRFVCYYLTSKPGPTVGGRATRLDLVRWQSVPFASFTQAKAIGDADERAEALLTLRSEHGIRHCWDPSKTVNLAFFEIDTDGTLGSFPEFNFTIEGDKTAPIREFFRDPRSSVAWNGGETQVKVPKYGIRSDAGDGFPHGFEVKIVGQAGSRQILMRLALLGWTPPGQAAYADSSVIVPLREF